MKAKYVNEALKTDGVDYVREVNLEDIINDNVRSNKSKEKLLDHLHKVYDFNPESPNIDKKELTRITNDLSSVIRNITGDKEKRNVFREELDALAKESGYTGIYDASDTKKDEFFRTVQFGIIWYVADATRMTKRLLTLNVTAKQQKFVNKWFPNLEDWSALGQKLEDISASLNPTKEQKREKELKIIKGAINPEIKKAIDEIAENFRQVIEKNEYDWYMQMIDSFKSDYPEGMTSNDRRDRRKYLKIVHILRFTKKQDPKDYMDRSPLVLIDKPEELAKKLSYEKSVETITSWQFKMYNKLGGFMSELNKKFTTEVFGGRARSNDIHFNFEDRSGFSIRNNIVSKISNRGTYFYTYPTTFHAALLPDGTKVKNPNEFTVKQAFNQYQNPKA